MAEPEDIWEAIDCCCEQGWAADGLPVVPPSEEPGAGIRGVRCKRRKRIVTTMEVVCRGVGGAGAAGRNGYVHQGQAPEDILLVVAGANNAGISTVLHPWGRRLSPEVGESPPQELPSMDHVTREIREAS